MTIGKFIFGIIGIALGTSFVAYTHQIVDNTFRIGFAEEYLGPAGTYTFYRILGTLMIIVSILVMIGVADYIYDGLLGSLGAM